MNDLSTPTKHFSKFARPQAPPNGRICPRDLDILEAVLRFRFCRASELYRLVMPNPNKSFFRRTVFLWRSSYLYRFAFSLPRSFQGEFVYYLEDRKSLELLYSHGRLQEIHPRMEDEIRANREAGYERAWLDVGSGQTLFLRHQLMISRLRFMLEMACRNSEVELSMFRPDLPGFRLEAPALQAVPVGNGQFQWRETAGTERLTVKPDALFTLTFPKVGRQVHFTYEADRGTMPPADMLKKMRAYQFLRKFKKAEEAFGVQPLRAVLIEVPDERRAMKLMELACHNQVAGPGRRSGLFWIIPSFFFAQDVEHKGEAIARYLIEPGLIFEREWGLPEVSPSGEVTGVSKHSLLDEENSPRGQTAL